MENATRLVITGLIVSGVIVTVACSGSNGGTVGGGDGGDAFDASSPTGDDGSSNDTDANISPGNDGSTADSGPGCTKSSDCASKICNPNHTCAAATCKDGVQNQDETDIDCGGKTCAACDVLKKCDVSTDCTSKVCKDTGAGLECQAPTSSDGVQNGTETDVDCGGAGNPECADGKKCDVRADCSSDVCVGGVCITPVCNDGQKNGTETDVDCGGPSCPRCSDNQDCSVAGDCIDGVCADVGAGLQCQPPSYTDGVENGTETDVDCGGGGDPTTYACAAGKMCLVDTDCSSDGCDYTKHCAIHRSCSGNNTGGRYGADTCGLGGAGGMGAANWESCCTTVPVTASEITVVGGKAGPVTVQMDKYKVTAGRMRQFLESVGYDVRTYVQNARAGGTIPGLPVPDPSKTNTQAPSLLPPAWDSYLPTSLAGDPAETPDCDQSGWDGTADTCKAGTTYAPMYTAAQNHVGPTIFKANSQTLQGCDYGSPGTHIYYLGAKDYYGESADFDQTIYDQKPIQCVDYEVAQAFCVWDGGRLETTQEWYAAYDTTSGVGTEASPNMPWTADGIQDSRGLTNLIPKTDLPGATNSPPASLPNLHTCTGTTDAYCASGKCPSYVAGNGATCAPAATYTSCRFPTATDTLLNNAGYIGMTGCGDWTVPDSAHTIELADYQYNYEWPALKTSDFSVFIAPPGRMLGRSSAGIADPIGLEFEISSNLTAYQDVPFPTTTFTGSKVSWSGNGSWEVHNFSHGTGGNGAYNILDKYGKMGLRCVH